MLTDNETGHFRKLIDLCVDTLGSEGCNDFPVPNTDENWELYVQMHRANDALVDVGPRPDGDRIWFMDWMLLRHLADLISKPPQREA